MHLQERYTTAIIDRVSTIPPMKLPASNLEPVWVSFEEILVALEKRLLGVVLVTVNLVLPGFEVESDLAVEEYVLFAVVFKPNVVIFVCAAVTDVMFECVAAVTVVEMFGVTVDPFRKTEGEVPEVFDMTKVSLTEGKVLDMTKVSLALPVPDTREIPDNINSTPKTLNPNESTNIAKRFR